MLVYIKKLSCILVKKLQIRFTLKITLSNHAIYQLAKEGYFNLQNNYIQAILRDSKQLLAIANYLEFENKKLMETLKTKKKKK